VHDAAVFSCCCCCCCQVLFFTFSSMIGLMLATFYVVVNTGAVRLAGID
jgi:hypothetical protein